ncbi:MAG: hypothetical protein FWE31_04690, partial [Firmicutes bacterium]|nr:hypothetical protein [Bacillota bacterium]
VNLIPDVLVEGMVRALVMEALPADLRNTIMNQVTVNLSEMFGLPGNVIISLTPGGQTTIPFLGTWQHDDIFDVMLGMAGLIDMSALIPAMMPDVDPVIVGILVTAMDEIDLADLLDRDATHAQQVDIVTDALMTVRNEVTVVLVGTAVDMLLDAVLWDDLDVMINEVFDLISDILAGIQI